MAFIAETGGLSWPEPGQHGPAPPHGGVVIIVCLTGM